MSQSQSYVRKILRAAEEGDKRTLQEAIRKGEVGVADEEGSTPLMCAAASGREEVLRMLLDKECLSSNNLEREDGGKKYMDLQNRYGWTALMQAAAYGHSGCVVLLLQRGADVSLLNGWNTSALVMASQGGYFGVVYSLINHGAQVNSEKLGADLLSPTLTPLMAASQCGHVEVVRELLRGGANLEVKLKSTNWTALMLAALNNQVSAVEILLQSGASKEGRDIGGRTAADLACTLGHQSVAVLLARGTISKNVSENSDLFEAVNKGNVSKVKELLSEKPSLACIVDKDGATPLMFASNKGYKDVCEVLLASKADINTKDKKYGWTALMHATNHRKYEVVELLGRFGADVNIRNSKGHTAFDIANIRGDIKMIKLIANITVEQLQKVTPTADNEDTPTLDNVELSNNSHSSTDDKAIPADDIATLDDTSDQCTTPTDDTTLSDAAIESSEDNSATSFKSPPLPSVPRIPPSGPIDLGLLKSRLQNAYATRPPQIEVSMNDRPSNFDSRFPTRMRTTSQGCSPFSAPSSIGSSSNSSSSSSGNSRPRLSMEARISSPSKSAPSPHLQSPTTHQPFTSPQNSSSSHSTRSSLAWQPSPSGRAKYQAQRGHGQGGLGRALPDRRDIPQQGMRTSGTPSLTSRLSNLEMGRVTKKKASRQRAETTPVNPTWLKAEKKSISGINNPDLKSILEQASMGHYFTIFQEEEVDEHLFVSLCEKDLVEMGIKNKDDRDQLVTLIATLKSQSSSPAPVSGGSSVFIFQ